MGALDGRHVVVTGGALGIGHAIAIGCAQAGAHVTCLDVQIAPALKTAQIIRSLGQRATAFECDLRDWESVSEAIRQAEESLGPVDILIANAGGAHAVGRQPFLEIQPEAFREMVDRNLHTAFNAGALCARRMALGSGGSIVFITSEGSEIGVAGLTHYCAAKGGVRMLMKAMAVELAPLGIRVNAVAPGPTETDGNSHLRRDEAVAAELAESVPLGRWAKPEEIVGAAVYLASDSASFTTGTTIFVDGGRTAS
ncbi:MAG TPA: SDR family NAD(P)-dependent oxidoreductase [Acidimicrobiales bacterium]|nr:SDR family NAD(P)-dependent oxidoreductase [Acidimicrobiales bacterium]